MLRRWIAVTVLPVLAGLAGLAAVGANEQPAFTTIRAITTSPDRYANRAVRITGRFRGRVDGDATNTALKPLKSRWDFLLKWDDDAVWVSGLRPLGRDFDLNPLSRFDAQAGRWLDVTGTVRVDHRRRQASRCEAGERCPSVWIEATDMRLAAPPSGILLQLALRPAIAPPTVVFHDPVTDEVDVSPTTAVRVQFSKHMAAETLSTRVRVSYGSPLPLFAAPVPGFHAAYYDETRALDIRFAAPLAAFETVRVELLEGIRARDGRALPPWTLTFTTGAQ